MPDKPGAQLRQHPAGVTKRWKDTWSAGQGIGATRAIEPVSAVVDAATREYDAALARVAALARESQVTVD